jgi:hypothetical protein
MAKGTSWNDERQFVGPKPMFSQSVDDRNIDPLDGKGRHIGATDHAYPKNALQDGVLFAAEISRASRLESENAHLELLDFGAIPIQ